MYKCILQRPAQRMFFHSEVQICSYQNMSMVQEGQYIPRDQWIHWDAESIAQMAAQEVQGIDTTSNCSESTILYELNAYMISQNNIEIVNTESLNNSNDLDGLPDINQLRAELTVLGGSDSPPPNFVMPTNYTPASPRYSPAPPCLQSQSKSYKH